MAKSNQIQVVRRAAEEWEVTRVRPLYGDVWEYEVIGRVVGDGGLYYAELPVWSVGESGYTWRRQPRGYVLVRGALRSITSPPTNSAAS